MLRASVILTLSVWAGCVPISPLDDAQSVHREDAGADVPAVDSGGGDGAAEVDGLAEVEEVQDVGSDAVPLGESLAFGAWTPCDLVPGDGSRTAHCALVSAPLDYSVPDGERIELFLKRFGPQGAESNGDVWMLHGGPSASAVDDLDLLSAQLYKDRPGLTFYSVDHRGIGGSARLDCPIQELPTSPGGQAMTTAEVEGCAAYLAANRSDLNQITTSNSARDIGHLIANLRPDAEHPVFVWGGSYGTYLAQRYMQLFPNQPTGVILDGISAPGVGFGEYSEKMNEISEAVFDQCGLHGECSSRLGLDPWARTKTVLASIDEGHCPALNTTSEGMRTFVAGALFYDAFRDLVPALVYRTERCASDDVEAIAMFAQFMGGATASPALEGTPQGPIPPRGLVGNVGDGRSYGLFYHIAASEMWPADAPNLAEAEAAEEALTVTTRLTARVARAAEYWPTFAHDEYVGRYAEGFERPLLMLQGGLDPATDPYNAQAVGDAYTGPAQSYAYFPFGAHGLVAGSLMANGQHCARQLVLAFIDAPAAPLDMRCIDDVLAPEFSGRPGYPQVLFGTPSAWD